MHSYSPYTAILRHPWIHSMGVVPSLLHQKVKFSTEHGIMEVRGDQCMARKCQIAAVGHKQEVKSGSTNPL